MLDTSIELLQALKKMRALAISGRQRRRDLRGLSGAVRVRIGGSSLHWVCPKAITQQIENQRLPARSMTTTMIVRLVMIKQTDLTTRTITCMLWCWWLLLLSGIQTIIVAVVPQAATIAGQVKDAVVVATAVAAVVV